MKLIYIPSLLIALAGTTAIASTAMTGTTMAGISQTRPALPEGVEVFQTDRIDINRTKLLQSTTRCTVSVNGKKAADVALAELRIFSASSFPELDKYDSRRVQENVLNLYVYDYTSADRKLVEVDPYYLLQLNADGSVLINGEQSRTGNTIQRSSSRYAQAKLELDASGKVKSLNYKQRMIDTTSMFTYLFNTMDTVVKCEFN